MRFLPYMVGLLALALPSGAARGQVFMREGFEGPTPAWRVVGADTQYRVEVQQRVQDNPREGDWCEYLRVNAANGTFLHFAFDTGEARVIDELAVSLWVRANRPGPQLLARIVLPRSKDPRTGRPATVIVRGDSYRNAGSWQELRLAGVPKLLEREAQLLRAQVGPAIDVREAYLDRVLLNAYTGQGVIELWTDNLEVNGYVRPPDGPPEEAPRQGWKAPGVPGADLQQAPGGSRLTRIGSQILIDGKPFFPRIIQHQGEPLAFLKRLGFNAVRLRGAPSDELLKEAAEQDMWLVAPPPVSPSQAPVYVPPRPIDSRWDQVLAWDLGESLSSDDFERTRNLATRVRQADHRMSRPLLCDALTDVRAFRRHVDILNPFRFPLGTTLELLDYGAWLQSRPRLAPGTPIWTTVQTQPSWALRRQLEVFSPRDLPPHIVASEQIRLATYAALSAGVRGLGFESQSRLDADTPEAQYRALTLEAINLELQLIEPWAISGSLIGTVPSGANPEVVGALLQIDRARLFLPMWLKLHAQFVAGQSAANNLTFIVPGVPDSYDAYEVSPAGLQRLETSRVTRGKRITLREFGLTSIVVFSEHNLVLAGMTRQVASGAQRAAQLHRELAAHRLSMVQQTDARLAAAGHAVKQSKAWIDAAGEELRRCGAALAARNSEQAYLHSRRALRPLRILERVHWDAAVSAFGSPVTNPLATSFESLPQLWDYASQWKNLALAPNQLDGGDCEDLRRMLAAGWRHYKHEAPELVTAADLAQGGSHSGQFSLRLKVTPEDPDAPPDLVETPPIWVTSSPVPIAAGGMVRIHGWVRVPAPVTGGADGLMIIDSLSGPALAERIGETVGWREFNLYRGAAQAGEVHVTFALTGLGEAWIDDVTIEPIVPKTPAGETAGRPRRSASAMSPPGWPRPLRPAPANGFRRY